MPSNRGGDYEREFVRVVAAADEQPQATLTDGGTSSGGICRRCGISPRDWEDLTDGLCPECSFDEVLYERY